MRGRRQASAGAGPPQTPRGCRRRRRQQQQPPPLPPTPGLRGLIGGCPLPLISSSSWAATWTAVQTAGQGRQGSRQARVKAGKGQGRQGSRQARFKAGKGQGRLQAKAGKGQGRQGSRQARVKADCRPRQARVKAGRWQAKAPIAPFCLHLLSPGRQRLVLELEHLRHLQRQEFHQGPQPLLGAAELLGGLRGKGSGSQGAQPIRPLPFSRLPEARGLAAVGRRPLDVPAGTDPGTRGRR